MQQKCQGSAKSGTEQNLLEWQKLKNRSNDCSCSPNTISTVAAFSSYLDMQAKLVVVLVIKGMPNEAEISLLWEQKRLCKS